MIYFLKRENGFSLLEAIVALVLLSSAGMAIFALVNTHLVSLGRIQQNAQNNHAIQITLEWVQQINPMETPEGESDLNGLHLQWHAKLIEPVKDSVKYPRGIGLYQVGLFDTDVSLFQDKIRLVQFTLRQVGYRKVRNPQHLLE